MKRRRMALFALLLAALDQLLKQLCLGIDAPLIPGLLALQYAENRGAAFSLLTTHPALLSILWAAAAAALVYYAFSRQRDGLEAFALTLLVGGMAGNALDRALRGFVVDYLRTLFIRFPIFNLADILITLGCALMCLNVFRTGRREKRDR